jgi:hypothetical protein
MRSKLAILLSFLALTVLAAGADSKKDMFGHLPDKLGDAGFCSQPEHFVGKGLFDYMNGGAELYLAYGFTDIGVRSYQKGDVKATVELYRMGSPIDAFGIFSHRAKGESVDIGIPATLSHGMLSFHKGPMYVRVVAATNPEKAKDVLVTVGKALAAGLPGESKPPAGLDALPGGAVKGSVRYLPNTDTARMVWFEGEGEVLLTKGARAFTAFYSAGDNDIQLTRTTYPGSADATKACQALAKKLGLEPKTEGSECSAAGKTPDDMFAALATRKGVLRWASGAENTDTAKIWLGKIK